MSISSQIGRLTNNITAAYTALRTKNATIPAQENSDNLAEAILSIGTPRRMLFDDGDVCSSVTGGWVKTAGAGVSISFNESDISFDITGSTGRVGGIYTKNKIDLTDYTKIYLKFDYITPRTNNGAMVFGVTATPYTANSAAIDFVSAAKVSARVAVPAVDAEYVLDISSLSGSFYVQIETGISNATLLQVGLM